MKICCPNCNASGNIPDHAVPETGRFLNCPSCKHGFTVTKPKATAETYEVDVCPACNYSTFGDERFSSCPKCGIAIKAFVERQKEEKQKQREFELLNKKHSRDDSPQPEQQEKTTPIADMIDNLHPVNLIGWGCAAISIIILCIGLLGLLDHNAADIKAKLSYQRDEQISSWYVFIHYGLMHWLKTVYGLALLLTSLLFTQQRLLGLTLLTILLRTLLVFIPLYLITSFILWIMQPIPHTISGYLVETINMVFMSSLFCIPLFLLDRFLTDKRIISVVKRPLQD